MVLACGALGCSRVARQTDALAEADELRLRYDRRSTETAVGLYQRYISEHRVVATRQAALAAQHLGATYQALGLLNESQQAYRDALGLAERTSDRLLAAEITSDLGLAEASVGNGPGLDAAEQLCQRALAAGRAGRGLRAEAKALACLGEVRYSRGTDFEGAVELQQDAKRAWEKLDDQQGVAQAWLSLGQL